MGAPSPKAVFIRDPVLDPFLLFLGDFLINLLFQADLDTLLNRRASPAASRES